ncbi:hypothetical protein PORY_002524 [Pneumocystis oryctolagi]|uniref:Uncharacterized protein n=1 Tax=Pneumocystis oryctolagi TaxID=42067 RepID=A0ACB7C916_9ASCO|nr:hypothetical protein PORY_002524 [Pneumocystis oryctolagi]
MNSATAILLFITLLSMFISDPFSISLWTKRFDRIVAQKVDIPMYHFKLLGCLLFSYPLSYVLRKIPPRNRCLRHFFNIIVSLFFLVGIFNLWYGVQTVLISTAGVFIIVQYLKGHYMPYVAFAFLIGHLSINHLYRQYGNIDDEFDVTGLQMVLCMKLTAFAWNMYDGKQEDSVLTQRQKEYALKKLPSLLEFLGYVFFFPSFLVGPSFDLVDYHRWLANGITVSTSKKINQDELEKRLICKDRRYSIKILLSGLFYLYVFQQMSLHYSVTYVLHDQFLQLTYIRRLLYLFLLALMHRMKYYGIWKIAEGACVLSGMGDSVRDSDGNIVSYFFENISPYGFETAQSTKELLDAWNKSANRWLKYYVYLRVTSHGKKPNIMSSMITFITSALWHGFYPGYYLSFITGAFAQILGKYLRRHVRPFFLTRDMQPTRYKIVYDVLSWFSTQITWAYIVQPFVVLNFRDSLLFWKRYNVYFLRRFYNANDFVILDKNILKFQKALNEQQYYEAHQLLRTVVNRCVKASQYDKAIDLLYSSSKTLLEMKQFASGGDLALYMVKVYDLMKLKPDRVSKVRVIDLLRLFDSGEPLRKRLIHDSLTWSGKYGDIAVGDSELHHEVGKILAHEGNLFEAEKHLVLGTRESFEPFMSLLRGYLDQDVLDKAPFYTSRAVFPYLMIHNIACAIQAYRIMARHLVDQHNVTTQILSSFSADIILFPFMPLMNFLCFLILTCQRTSSDLFFTLKAHYEDALKQAPSWKQSLDKIAETYFGIRAEGAPTNEWANLMRQLFSSDLAPSDNSSSSRSPQRLPSNTHETIHETLD